MVLVRAIIISNTVAAVLLLAASPALARRGRRGRGNPPDRDRQYFEEIQHYLYAGDATPVDGGPWGDRATRHDT